ncbi:MAG TPA: hypothetical protein PKC59_05715 [Burkholderiaceae bacterium]|nr:hypothetical protein [Burkholderiaceae bacterium]HMX09685.1 hypothetical protein [Burkholderiaceae bacterium]HNG78920.1 hypothetical protein [Burkholderiaceae bacterium]
MPISDHVGERAAERDGDRHEGRSGVQSAGDEDDPAWCATVPAGLDDHGPMQESGRGDDAASAPADPGRAVTHDGAGHGGLPGQVGSADHGGHGVHTAGALTGDGGGCGLPDVPTPAELGGLLDGLVSDFRQGASVLAWHLAEPAKEAASGGDGWHLPATGSATGPMIGVGRDAALAPSLDLHDLLGGGGHALLHGLDLEAALQRALDSTGAAHGTQPAPTVQGLPEVHHFSAGDAAVACAPASSQGASTEPAHAASSHGGGGEAQHALVSLELGWSSGGAAASPLAPLLDPHRHGNEGC